MRRLMSVSVGLFVLLIGGDADAANFQVYNDKVWAFPIQCVAETTSVVGPCPAGTAFTAVSSLPASLSATVAANTLTLTPLVRASPGISVTISSVGFVSQTFVVDISTDPNQLGVSLNTAGVVTTLQAIPTAPGP